MTKINVYTGVHCPNCMLLKQYLRDKGVEFTEKSITVPENLKFLSENKISSIPVLEVDGELHTGFDKAKVDAILKMLKK